MAPPDPAARAAQMSIVELHARIHALVEATADDLPIADALASIDEAWQAMFGPYERGEIHVHATPPASAGEREQHAKVLETLLRWEWTPPEAMLPAIEAGIAALRAPAPDQSARQEVVAAELLRIAAFVRTPGNIWVEDAVDECARVLENRAHELRRGAALAPPPDAPPPTTKD